eukprot:gene32558-53602_t
MAASLFLRVLLEENVARAWMARYVGRYAAVGQCRFTKPESS